MFDVATQQRENVPEFREEARHQRVFISYARQDGVDLALRLQSDLQASGTGLEVWLDRQRIGGGENWTAAVEEAIDRAQVVLALLTPASYSSDICRAEQLRSLRKGKCVIPLIAAPGADIPLHLEAKNYRDFTQQSYDSAFQALIGDIESGRGVPLPERYRRTPEYVTAPPEVQNRIHRPDAIRALRDTLFSSHGHGAIAVTALEGMGGIGKTVMAQALFQDQVVREAFPDGMVWITVGREPAYQLPAKLREITKVLGGAIDEALAPETLYRTAVANKAALIVIDDIWDTADLDPFLAESRRSRFLFTTRDASIARFQNAREHRVQLLGVPEARELLAVWSGRKSADLPAAAEDILRECGGLPLALSTVGALLRGATATEWLDTATLLHKADLAAIEEQIPEHRSFFRAIDVSVKALPPNMQQWYGRLAVLLHNMPAPLPILQALWGVDEVEARRMGRRLADRSLAQRDDESGLRLHDLQLDYVRSRYPDLDALELIHGAVKLSSHVIEKDPRQFASQVVGRLLPHGNLPAIREFQDELATGSPRPWLRPLQPTLRAPGTPLLQTLEGHGEAVYGVAVRPDGRGIVSASQDNTLKLWDLATGQALRTLHGHSNSIWSVAVTPDGNTAVSASLDNTLKVWDLEMGRLIRTLDGHTEYVRGVAVTPDGKRAISASEDQTLRLWDLETGLPLHTLKGHNDGVYDVAVTPDGKRAVSASSDKTLRVWDLESGGELRILEGHGEAVYGVVVTPDGKRAISASRDNTLKVWDLETGGVMATLEGHSGWVRGVAVTPDGKRAVSASDDNTLKVWDLETGGAPRTLDDHSAFVYRVAVTPDGKRAVSASNDKTLKVWDLEISRVMVTPPGHTSYVSGLVATPDFKRAVSASWDGTLKLWDVETGGVLRTMEGHSAAVLGVAAMADGRRVVSASLDNTLKMWDLETGRSIRTLEGHRSGVFGVVVMPDGKRAVSASWDGTLKVWDLENGFALRTLQVRSLFIYDVAVTPDGKHAVSASADTMLKIWDLETGSESLDLEGHSKGVFGVDVTPDGKRAVSASLDKTLKVWDLETGVMLRTLEGHTETVSGVTVMPDGKRAVSASWDKTLKVWDLETGVPVATFHCDAAAWSCTLAGEQTIIGGDARGRLHFLLLVDRPRLYARTTGRG